MEWQNAGVARSAGTGALPSRRCCIDQLPQNLGPVGENAIDAGCQQRFEVLACIDRVGMNQQTQCMRVRNQHGVNQVGAGPDTDSVPRDLGKGRAER